MSRFESGCRRFTEMYPNWRRDLPRKQTGRVTGVGVQSLRSAPVGAGRSSTGASAPLHLRYAPVAHLEEATGLSPVRGGFGLRSAPVGARRSSTGASAPLREYIPLYQNGIWIRLRLGGLRVRLPPRVFSVCGAMEDALCSGHSPRGCGFDSRHTDFMEDCRNGRRGRFKPGFLRVRIPCPSFTTSRKGGISHAMH